MASGDTKTQQYLDIAARGTRADLQRGCCNTRTQDLIMDVAERIITEEETRYREDQILQGEIDEIKNNPDVYDIVPTYAALQAYDTSGLTDKDIIRVLSDETHGGASTYYRWSTTTETFTYIGEVGDYYTKTQVDTLLDGKQDELTAGDNITIEDESGALVISATDTTYTAGTNVSISSGNVISATDTTYTAGTGLNLNGTEFSADTTVLATQTDLSSKQNTLTAGSNITISGDTISATDTTYSAFTGTDGTAAGSTGLVPAPATTDAGKFLKADGTWDTAGGGGGTGAVVELTTADYDYTYGGTSGVALWRLEAGLYHTANDVQAFAGSGTNDLKLSLKSHLIIIDDDSNRKLIKVVGDNFTSSSGGVYKGFIQYQVATSDGSGMLAQSESVISTASLMRKIGSTPTSSTVGFRGQLWYDSANNKLYINVNAPSDYAGNWKEISLAS